MSIEFNEIMKMLNCKNDIETQELGIQLASKLNCIDVFIQPDNYGNKGVWENCAKIIATKNDNELEPYLINLLNWLQDINWPGALIILKRLKNYQGIQLVKNLELIIDTANTMNNEDGLMWLDYLSELLDNQNLKNKLSKKHSSILKKHYHNWCYWYKN